MNKDINNIPVQKPYKNLTPFCLQIIQNFPFIEADFDAITNQQILQKVVDYLNQVIENENAVTENTQNLYNAFVELENYVNNYFNDLDIQTEIDSKLDEMAQDGTLAQIIEDYATIPQLTEQVNKLNLGEYNREIILVGDSYLAGQSLTNPSTENFGYLLMQKLKMNTNNFHIWAEGGSSFYQSGNAGHTWQTLIQSKLNTITVNNITDIFFVGGYNEVTATSPAQIETAMSNCINYCKNTFPNAKIYVDLIANNASNLSEQVKNRNLLKNRIYNVYCQCFKYGAIFIDKGQLPLQNYTLFEDNETAVHPNSQGHIAIANYLFQNIMKGNTDYKLQHNAFNLNLPENIGTGTLIGSEIIENNIVKLGLYAQISLATTITNNQGQLDFGEQPNLQFMKYVPTSELKNVSTIQVTNGTDTTNLQNSTIILECYINNNNHLILKYYKTDDIEVKNLYINWKWFDFSRFAV